MAMLNNQMVKGHYLEKRENEQLGIIVLNMRGISRNSIVVTWETTIMSLRNKPRDRESGITCGQNRKISRVGLEMVDLHPTSLDLFKELGW